MWYKRGFISKCICYLFGLFFIGIFINDYYQSSSNVDDQLYNENLSIEQAIEQMSICTPEDRSRHQALLHTLKQWNHLAQQHHIQYWIAYGTLVGYVQRRGLLPHDPHIDLFIMAKDTSKLKSLSLESFLSTYLLKVHPQWYLVGPTYRSYFYADGIDFLTPNARFVNLKEDIYLNIWPIYDYNPDEGQIEPSKTKLTAYDRNYQWRSSPIEWTFPLRECQFSGIKVWCPAQAEKLVADLYGEVSLRKSWIKCVNGSWIKLDNHTSAVKIGKISNNIPTKQSTTLTTTMKPTTDDLNNLDEIEKALEDIPTCTDDDRDTQRLHLTIFQAWAKLAEKYNLQYWIVYGTLVGYVRRHGFLPHDLDLDVTMMTNDVPKLINISQTYFSSNYEIKVHPQWNVVGYENRRYSRKQGINFVAPNARFFHLKSRRYVDIFPAYDYNPLTSNDLTVRKPSENLTEYGRVYEWISYPRSWTYPLQTCYFSGIKTLCPAKPERLVEMIYGKSALNQSDTKCVNGIWVEGDSNEEK